MADPELEVRDLAAPLVEREGVDLLSVDIHGKGLAQRVRIVVDRKGGVPIETIQEISQGLSVALDSLDVLEGQYALEVSSPGTDYPLTAQRDFERVEGRAVLVQHDAGDGRVLQVRGTVRSADEQGVLLDVEGNTARVPYAQIVKASQSLPW